MYYMSHLCSEEVLGRAAKQHKKARATQKSTAATIKTFVTAVLSALIYLYELVNEVSFLSD